MTKRSLHITVLISMILSLSGCRDMSSNEASVSFTQSSKSYGVWLDGEQVLVKNDYIHQESRRSKSYRIQTDDQSIYIDMLFNNIPTVVGETCTVTISSRGVDKLSAPIVDMVLQKTGEDMLWLWNENKKIGIVIPILK